MFWFVNLSLGVLICLTCVCVMFLLMSVCFDFVFCLCSLLFAAVRRHHHLSLCSPAFSLPYLIPLSHSTLSHSVIPHSLIPPFRSLPFHSLIPPFRSLSFRHSAFYHSVIPLSLRHSDLSHSSSLRHPSPYSNLLFRVKVSSQPPPWPRVSIEVEWPERLEQGEMGSHDSHDM